MRMRETRSFVRLNLLSLAFTAGGIAALLLMVSAVVAFPLAFDHIGLGPESRVHPRPGPMAAAVRGPAGRARASCTGSDRAGLRRGGNGSAAGTLAAGAALDRRLRALSWYLSNFGNYNATYGSLGAAIGLMMWMWMSATIVLFGAELNSEIERQTAADGARSPPCRDSRAPPRPIGWSGSSGRAQRTLALRINIDAKVAALGGARGGPCRDFRVFPGWGQFGPEGVARNMIRISTIFIAICMVLVAASLGLVLYSVAGISGTESAIVALTALTFLILYNAVSMRLRDRTDVGGQIADLSRGTADLARQVAEFGRRLAAVEGRVVSANSAGADRIQAVVGEINELGALVKQLAVSVASHDDLLAASAAAAPPPRLPAKADNRTAEQELPLSTEAVRHVTPLPPLAAVPTAGRRRQPARALAQPAANPRRGEERRRGEPDRHLPAADGDAAAAQGALLRGGDAAARRQGPDSRRRRFHRDRRSRRADRADRHMVMLRCVQVLRRLMVRNKDVGVFCNVSAATLGNPATFAQCLDFLEANRALAPSFVLEFKQATFRNLGPTETEHLAALAQRGYRFSIDHVTDLRIEPRELADRGVRFIKVPAALLLDQQAELDLGHPSVRPFRPARPLRHRPDRRADRGRARGGRPARLRRAVRPGLPVCAAPAVAARGRICYRRGRSEQGAGTPNGSGNTVPIDGPAIEPATRATGNAALARRVAGPG